MVVLLAIDPSTRETGWAVFVKRAAPPLLETTDEPQLCQPDDVDAPVHPRWKIVETGVIIAHPRPQRVEVATRVKAIQGELERMVAAWDPQEVACGKPSPMQLPQQQAGVEMLRRALERWAQEHDLPLYYHQLKDIRSAMLGRAIGASQELAFAVMNRWGLLGEARTTAEWNAIAVGDYHLCRRDVESDQET